MGEVMMHPTANKPMLLCGQTQGYVTAYDLPDFRPRGSFVCKNNSDIKAIKDVKCDGLFLTGGMHGDIMVWQWTGQSTGGQQMQQMQQAANPFAQGPAGPVSNTPVVNSPFAIAAAPCMTPSPGIAGVGVGGPSHLMMG